MRLQTRQITIAGICGAIGVVLAFTPLGLIPVPLLLRHEHRIARTLDVEKINRAFFETNAVIGLLFVAITAADRFFI